MKLDISPETILPQCLDIFLAGVRGVLPERLIPRSDWTSSLRKPLDQYEKVHVLSIGKSGLSMASVVDAKVRSMPGERLIVVPQGYRETLPEAYHVPEAARIIEAGHPISNEASVRAGERALEIAAAAGKDDLVLVLLSGGGSALCVSLAGGIQLEDARVTMRLLLESGADIRAVNTVRKHLSAISGGQLARAAAPADVLTLAISDVRGDDLSVIASGPTVADETTFSDALAVVEMYKVLSRLPESVRVHLEQGAAGAIPETVKPGDGVLGSSISRVIGSNRHAMEAAQQEALRFGYNAYLSSDFVEGEARDVGKQLVQEALQIRADRPVCLIWGGETTVTVRGSGLGGRNQEMALAAAMALAGSKRQIVFLSAGTDGRDGPSPAAGAIATPSTISQARGMGLLPEQFLAANDAYHFFERVGGLIMTGPTHANVMDLQIALVLP